MSRPRWDDDVKKKRKTVKGRKPEKRKRPTDALKPFRRNDD